MKFASLETYINFIYLCIKCVILYVFLLYAPKSTTMDFFYLSYYLYLMAILEKFYE